MGETPCAITAAFEKNGPKKNFFVFDFCQNLEYFSQNPQGSEGFGTPPLHARLFRARLALLKSLIRLQVATRAKIRS